LRALRCGSNRPEFYYPEADGEAKSGDEQFWRVPAQVFLQRHRYFDATYGEIRWPVTGGHGRREKSFLEREKQCTANT
jgi:hypothetical protein